MPTRRPLDGGVGRLLTKREGVSMQLMQWVSADPNTRTKLTHPYDYDPFTMWRGPGEPDGSVYTDRLLQWDHEKHDALCMKHFGDRGQYWDRRTPQAIQTFLRDYLDAPELVLCEVQEHCNQATGYPCWYFAYRKTPNAKVSGAGTASAGLPGYTAGDNTE